MCKFLIASTVLFASLCAHAERMPARKVGLPPESGYVEAVTPGEKCVQGRDILLQSENWMTNCDHTEIGWITMTLNGAYLRPRPTKGFEDSLAEQAYVLDQSGREGIILYTCGDRNAHDHRSGEGRFVLESTPASFTMESFPPLKQEAWSYYRSQGLSRLSVRFDGGRIVAANLKVLQAFNRWLEDKLENKFDLDVPLKCVRSYLPLDLRK